MTKIGGRDKGGRFTEGNALGLRHGGAGAVQAIHDGKEFLGLARETEIAVHEELARGGRLALLRRNAARLQAAADLYHGAMMGAAEAGNLEQFTRHLKTWGWLVSSTVRAWLAVGDEERRNEESPTLDYEQILEDARRRDGRD